MNSALIFISLPQSHFQHRHLLSVSHYVNRPVACNSEVMVASEQFFTVTHYEGHYVHVLFIITFGQLTSAVILY